MDQNCHCGEADHLFNCEWEMEQVIKNAVITAFEKIRGNLWQNASNEEKMQALHSAYTVTGRESLPTSEEDRLLCLHFGICLDSNNDFHIPTE